MFCFGPYTILAWTVQSVKCHIALKAMFYLLNVVNNEVFEDTIAFAAVLYRFKESRSKNTWDSVMYRGCIIGLINYSLV